ncbi:hypothetical protein [Streptomyces sp. IB2014 016-6]|uniref:hypothetical protein n=1 Tax=Streptomyces sp. IB2014 016-6 TaxID=2517818 RepID=UPI0011CBD128|nr:hypothetical protein [Streptomyces sp. IB2014 016-6]TXL90456.1 hypothetical protein EW053_11560 [Streptomyces sp. IB2014 016-6]
MSTSPDDAHAHYTTPLHDALRTALRTHGLHVPGLSVEQGAVHLGDVTVTTADRLARLLGAPVQETRRNLDEWPEARLVMRRLGAAFKTVTGGGFLDLYFHHDCVRCDRDAAVTLSPISLREAQRLLSALSRTASLPSETREATAHQPHAP